MKNIFKDIIKPIIVLVCICLVVSGLLAYINTVTAPIIKESEEKTAQQAMSEVLKSGDSFELMTVSGLDKKAPCVTEVYRANNKAGYVFMLSTKGYGGEMKLICGINSDGTISACKTLSHGETSGLGSKTTEDAYKNQYCGKSSNNLDEVDAISGATISSTAYMNAIKDAFKAFEIAKEVK